MIISKEEAELVSITNKYFIDNIDRKEEIFICRCAPDATHILAGELTTEGYPAFTPMYSFEKRIARHSKKKSKKYSLFFPSYLFVVGQNHLEDFRGRLTFLKFADSYATMTCSEIIKFNEVMVESRNREESFLKGDKVRVLAGVFTDMEATILNVTSDHAKLLFDGSHLEIQNFPLDSVSKVCYN